MDFSTWKTKAEKWQAVISYSMQTPVRSVLLGVGNVRRDSIPECRREENVEWKAVPPAVDGEALLCRIRQSPEQNNADKAYGYCLRRFSWSDSLYVLLCRRG